MQDIRMLCAQEDTVVDQNLAVASVSSVKLVIQSKVPAEWTSLISSAINFITGGCEFTF